MGFWLSSTTSLGRRIAITLALASSGAAFVAVLEACGDSSDQSTGETSDDASTPSTRDAHAEGSADAGILSRDASSEDAASHDAETRDANRRDANGPGAEGDDCILNWDCELSLRCECDEVLGCSCARGARGPGQNGKDSCPNDGNACASGLCIEGPPDSGYFCSDECESNTDCFSALPVCKPVATIGKICVRQPPQ